MFPHSDSWFHQICLWWPTYIRCQTNYRPLRSHETTTYQMLLGARKVTDLWREDIISHVPDPLSPAVVGVAHSFHFGEDGADGRVCGLVTFLIDENPPVHETESILFKIPLHPKARACTRTTPALHTAISTTTRTNVPVVMQRTGSCSCPFSTAKTQQTYCI